MEQSSMSIDKTIDLLEGYGMFKNLSTHQLTQVLKALNNIANSGYSDARTAFRV
jgi:hypothetical protein